MAVCHISTAAQNACVDAIVALVDADAGAGKILIYNGTIPTNANTAVGAQTLLATVNLATTSYGAASSGTATGTDPASVNAVASGTASWFRQTDNSGDVVMDGDVTATGGGGTMTLSTTTITSGSPVDITSLTITMPAS
jgi:hypothetical protein